MSYLVYGMGIPRAALAFCALKPMRVISAALFDLSIGQADVEAQIAGNKAAREKQRAAGYMARPPPPAGWNDHQDDETLKKSLGAAAKADLHALTRLIHTPVLIATGDHDPNLGVEPRASTYVRRGTG